MTRPNFSNPLGIVCTQCGAGEAMRCIDPRTREILTTPHIQRRRDADLRAWRMLGAPYSPPESGPGVGASP